MKWTPIIAIVCVTLLEAMALLKGINGAIFGVAVATIAGLGGYEIKTFRDRKKGGK